MKPRFLFIFIPIACFLASCNQESLKISAGIVEIEDYFFKTFSCSPQYSKLVSDTVYVINSAEEFQTLVSCTDETAPGIDFDRFSLLFTYGMVTSGIQSLTKSLQQVSSKEYTLDVEIILDMTTVAPVWGIAVLTPKISRDAIVRLNKNIH